MNVLSQLGFLIRRSKPRSWCIYFASAGIACVVYKNKDTIKKYLQLIYKLIKPGAIKLVTNESEGKYTVALLNRKCHEVKVLGLDCEWITTDNGRKPVALLQLATSDGFCSLFQLCHFDKIPTELFELLNNKSILKVGVAIHNDAKYLMADYGLRCEGFLDLRYLARHVGEKPQGLAGLAKDQLGVELDKNWRIRCSNWEDNCLTQKQINYAAKDAQVAVEIFHKLNKKQLYKNIGWFKCVMWSKKTYWENSAKLWKPYINLNFIERGSTATTVTKTKPFSCHPKKLYHTLTKPHYSNIYLLAPDGQVLCTISASKSDWYVEKELADVVSEDPLTIKLRFEPSARETDPNGYYTRAKKNICVVCGSEESFRRKNVVPLEYRRQFPVHMKEHSSHDVLLLCLGCHTRSNYRDQQLRERLGYMCNAPIKDKNNVKIKEIPELRNVRSAARALYLNSDVIPEKRKNELKKIICEYLNIDSEQISLGVLEELKDMNCCVEQEDFVSHGEKVIEHFASDSELSLEQFERLWRQHFVDTMSPQYLPELWSVDHKRS